ncbi:MAG TPA: fasciclin domain-containing protein, partial [Rhodothermales bacterium]|nr:fasciclin domain-containing protein [Rhodothermales bacterium]
LEAGLDSTLNGEGPLTVFAPTNAAFARLPEGRLDALLDDANHAELVRLLRYHVVSGRLETSSLPGPASYSSLLGHQLSIEPTADGVFVSDASGTRARVITPDLNRGNGVLHVINAVLTAPEGDVDSTAAAP